MQLDECPKSKEGTPPPPRLKRNFSWEGRYLVPDLKVNVPFTWNANNGNIQMTAGGFEYPIYFTNLIYNGYLYTYTYKWPDLLPPHNCDRLFSFTIDDLNAFFATSRYVGPEILEGTLCQRVHHFRAVVVVPPLPPGRHFRIAVAEADIYVSRVDSSKFVKVLHFGYQNLFDPSLDEWIVINKFSSQPGQVSLPAKCKPPKKL